MGLNTVSIYGRNAPIPTRYLRSFGRDRERMFRGFLPPGAGSAGGLDGGFGGVRIARVVGLAKTRQRGAQRAGELGPLVGGQE